MKKIILIAFAILCCCQLVMAQKASDVLENGIHVKSGQKIFLQYNINNKKIEFDVAKSLQDVQNTIDFTSLEDSVIFLISKNAINVYLRPLNPLNFISKTDNKIVFDPINEAAATALGSTINVIESVSPYNKAAPAAPGKAQTPNPVCAKFDTLEARIKVIQGELNNNKKDSIVYLYNMLEALSFVDEASTKEELKIINSKIKGIEVHFRKIESLINKAEEEVKGYDCDYPEAFIAKFVFNSVLKDLGLKRDAQIKRLKNLQSAYHLVEDMQKKASRGGGAPGLNWVIELDEIPSREGNISIYTITIQESGYMLSEDKEIVAVETKDILSRTFRIRQFQRFVPEVSVGTAFTFFEYKTYGTTSDSTGQQYVSSPTEVAIRNLNFTTMVNFNYFIPNSPLHPLWQIGAGVNTEVPTILTGFGIRSNINGVRRIAVAGGIAATWMRELDTLQEGDRISGTSDIEKDLKLQFSGVKPYIGLQYNF